MRIYRTVRCPKCGKYRKTSSLKVVKCFFCGSSFDVVSHTVSEEKYKKEMDRDVNFK